MSILRVENLGDDLGHGFLLHRLYIFTPTEQGHIDGRGAFGPPQAQRVYGPALITRDKHVEWNRQHRGIISVYDL
ncbi:hypothetical protein SDC9_133530 [bioreactor metagenome]|uniref:Uncharacterized protein n=1 Tax=bioreactor metagenome TaxID=1076179 RepID=A0A645DAX0_9ZZZZ